MENYIVTLVSDWDEDRFHVESILVNSKENAEDIVKTRKHLCSAKFKYYDVVFEDCENDGYFACYKDEPSLGWEKCIITKA